MYNKQTTSSQQLLTVLQRIAHERCCVQHVSADDSVALIKSKALQLHIGVDVQQRVFNEGKL
eukprot:2912851-Prymnesium_polylepis.1